MNADRMTPLHLQEDWLRTMKYRDAIFREVAAGRLDIDDREAVLRYIDAREALERRQQST